MRKESPKRITSLPAAFFAAVFTVSVFVTAGEVYAATISVTTTEDVIAIDGQCSLREAVTAANTNMPFSDCPQGDALPATDVIELPAGTYSLTLLPIGEDANLGGDLDILEAVTLRGLGDDFIWWDDPDTPEIEMLDVWGNPEGFPRTFTEADLPDVVIENGLGKPGFPGDGDRVIHTLEPTPPALSPTSTPPSRLGGTPTITFENLAVAHGDDTCGPDVGFCDTVGAGIFHDAAAALRLERVALYANQSSCTGSPCGADRNASALRMASRQDLDVIESVFADNEAICADTQCVTGTLLITNHAGTPVPDALVRATLIEGNRQTCSATDCRVTELMSFQLNSLTIEQTAIIGNEIHCAAAGNDCETEPLVELDAGSGCDGPTCALALRDLEIAENRLACEGFQCDTDALIRDSSSFIQQSVQRVRIRDNEQRCTGIGCDVNELISLSIDSDAAATLDFEDVEMLDNIARCTGTSCDADGGIFSRGRSNATLSDVTLRAEVICEGDDCEATNIVDLIQFATITRLTVLDSVGRCTGSMCRLSPLIELNAGFQPGTSTIEELVVSGSQLVCEGAGCGFAANSGNQVVVGGMIDLRQDNERHTVLSNAIVTNNISTEQGTLSLRGLTTIIGGTFSGNSAAGPGAGAGAIRNGVELGTGLRPAELTLEGTMIDGNMVTGTGGGIFNQAGSTLRLRGSAIDNNDAADGGGIWNEGDILLRQGTTIDGNTPNGCVDAGAGTGCELIHNDDFETGDTSFWSMTIP